MNLLVVDTATPRVSVAVSVGGAVAASSGVVGERRHGELLAPAISLAVADAGLAFADLHALAVDVGPGLFTGLRVGVATVKGLAAALRIPVVAVSSLDALAWPWRHEPRPVAAVVDARRGEVFAAITEPSAEVPGPGRTEILAPGVLAPDALAARLGRLRAGGPAGAGTGILVVGDGARRHPEVVAGDHIEVGPSSSDHPDAAAWAALAEARFGAGAAVDAASVQAVYLRQADVRIGWSERSRPAIAPRRAG